MSKINKIKLSGTTYELQDLSATSGKVDTSTYTAYTATTDTAIQGKQDTLTAGNGIDITNNVISVTGGSGGGISSAECQTMIDQSISGKVDNSVYTAYTSVTDTALSNKVSTSAVTSAVTSGSTDSEIPTAKAVNDKLGGLSLVKLTQVEYDALVSGGTIDNSTLYIITNVVS